MKLNVEIESGSFEKVITDGIASLTNEEVKDLIKQVFLEAFTKCKDMSNMLITWERPNSWNSEASPTLGPMAEKALQDLDLGPEVDEIKTKMVSALIEHHRDIVEEMLMKMFLERIADDVSFRRAVEYALRRALNDARQG